MSSDVVSGTGPASSSGPNSADQLFNPTPADTTPAGTTVTDTAATSSNDTANLTNVNETVTGIYFSAVACSANLDKGDIQRRGFWQLWTLQFILPCKRPKYAGFAGSKMWLTL